MDNKKEYHILSLSGGKDSTALAFFMRDNMPDIFEKLELVFYDTGCDLPETYDYLNKIEIFLNKKITRVKPEKNFDHIFHTNFLIPAPHRRYCTIELKVKPSWKYIYQKIEKEGKGIFYFYIGIRADESWRKGISPKTEKEKSLVIAKYPLIENQINKNDVENILINKGIFYPDYYKWRARNGCYFCFYQKPIDWINLYEKHPELYKKAMYYEETGLKSRGEIFRWCSYGTLREMIKKENLEKIKENQSTKKQSENIELKLIDNL